MNSWETGFTDGLRPDEPLTVSEFADKHIRLSSKSSAEPGPWRTSRTPFLREVMDELSAGSLTERVVLMFGAQTGKTSAGLNWLAYLIAHNPGPVLCVQPTLEMCKRLSKQRLEDLIKDTPIVNEKIAPARARDSDTTLFSKTFPGGIMLLTGANSPTGLRSAPCKNIFLDEVDAYPVTAEGDAIELAIKRASTFSKRKILITSTPTIKHFSRVEAEYERSDQRRWFIPCPHCGWEQVLRFPQLKWEKDRPETAEYECEKCGERFGERCKTELLRKGRWLRTGPENRKIAGFHLSSLCSPLGWLSWAELADEFLRAKNNAATLQTFVNTRLGETFEPDHVAKVSAEGLLQRVDDYAEGTVPVDVVLITQGVDVQQDRLEISTWGWGPGETAYLIDHQQLWGDPIRPEVWQQLDALITTEWQRVDGYKLRSKATAVDSGFMTATVYQYARERQALGVIAIKGQSQRNKPPLGKPVRVDINRKGQTLKKGGTVYPVGSDTIKSLLIGRLKITEPEVKGSLHFHRTTSEEYFKQLTAERQQRKTSKTGVVSYEWVLTPGMRAEALDCMVYAYAAVHRCYQLFDRRSIWDQMAKRVVGEDKTTQRPITKLQQASASNYVENW